MRIALVADLHGNRPATLALEQDLARMQPDRVLCLGDIVGKGPSNDFTFDWAMQHCEIVLGGNWDFGVGKKQFSPDQYYWDQLGTSRMERLCRLPLEYELVLSGRRIRLFHGRPLMEKLIPVQGDISLIEPFFLDGRGGRYDVVGYADAHRPGPCGPLRPACFSTPAAWAMPWACPNAAMRCWKERKVHSRPPLKSAFASWTTTGNRPCATRWPRRRFRSSAPIFMN